jgi:hypothetical protein
MANLKAGSTIGGEAVLTAGNISSYNLNFLNGNVGIGTTNPVEKLSIVGSIKISNALSGNPVNEDVLGSIGFEGPSSINTNASAGVRLDAIAEADHSGTSAATGLQFYTKPSTIGPGSVPTPAMRIDSSGNVGIGTTSPNAKLDIYTTGASAWGLKVRTDNGDADSIKLVGGGGDSDVKFVVKGSGNVGIGTTNPDGKFQVKGGLSYLEGISLSPSSGNVSEINSGSSIYSIQFKRGSIDTMAIKGDNVGIGTTSPNEPLHVVDNRVDGTGKPVLKLSSPAIPAGMFSHSVHALNPNLTAEQNQIIIVGKENSLKNSGYVGYKWYGDGSNSNLLTFGHYQSDNLVNITPTGNVGIGTLSPDHKLEVKTPGDKYGCHILDDQGVSLGGLFVSEQGAAADGLELYLKKPAGTTKVRISAVDGNPTYFNAGNVGIGTTDPESYKLNVNGSTNIQGALHADSIFLNTGDKIFTDAYHPNADAWTTSRTLSLSGDLSGSVSIGGGANMTLTATVSGHNRYLSSVVFNNDFTGTYDTSDFINELTNDMGCFNNNCVSMKVSWSYAGNRDLDLGDDTLELAGCVIETWGQGTYKHIRITRPNTGTGGPSVWEYNDQGSGYAPGWRRYWTDRDFEISDYCLNNDSRLSDARTPTNHSADKITSGTLSNDRIPAATSTALGGVKVSYNEASQILSITTT